MTTPDPTPTKKRKVKGLPLGLSELNERNFRSRIKARYETNPKEDGEVMVAYEATLEDNTTVDLTTLTLDQLRQLCKNVGVRYVNKCTKFQCRKALWVMAQFQLQREQNGQSIPTSSDKTTNNLRRITNIIFSSDFFESFITLNDSKSRADHEMGELPKDFWDDVAEASMNGSDDDDSNALQTVIAEEDEHSGEIKDVDLEDFDLMTSSAIKKKVNLLLKVRQQIQKNMTISGEHDSDPYNFVETAMHKVGRSGLSVLGAYYFYTRCDDKPEVDVRFTVEMDISLKGSTTEVDLLSNSADVKRNEKRNAYAAMVEISNTTKTIAVAMDKTNQLAEKAQLISVATALGKNEILEDLLRTMSSSNSE